MAIVSLTPQAATVQGFQLSSSADMWTALTWLSGHGYTGNIAYGQRGGTDTWWLTFTNGGTSYAATVGDWVVVENSSVASVCKASVFANLYAVT